MTERSREYLAEIAGIFLDHGADPYTRTPDAEIPVTDLIVDKLGDWNPRKTRELLGKVVAAKKTLSLKTSKKKRMSKGLWCFG